LIRWFSKTEGNTYATLLHHPFLFKGKPTHAQEVAACEGAAGVELLGGWHARDGTTVGGLSGPAGWLARAGCFSPLAVLREGDEGRIERSGNRGCEGWVKEAARLGLR
jgi:hypothetical protein